MAKNKKPKRAKMTNLEKAKPPKPIVRLIEKELNKILDGKLSELL
jgi:hypothetical protein